MLATKTRRRGPETAFAPVPPVPLAPLARHVGQSLEELALLGLPVTVSNGVLRLGTRYIVMVFLAGYGSQSKALQYRDRAVVFKIKDVVGSRAVEFRHDEVSDRRPNEILVFALEKL